MTWPQTQAHFPIPLKVSLCLMLDMTLQVMETK